MSERRPRILLADDHPMMLAGLHKLLEPELEIVAAVTDGLALVAAAGHLQPDLIVTDVAMPGLDGIQATVRLQKTAPEARVLILSIYSEPSRVHAAFEAGAWGYLPKTSAPEEIERAVHEVLAGRFYISPAVARAAVSTTPLLDWTLSPAAGGDLTERETEIIRLVAQGLGNQRIAEQLGVAVTTVRTHLSSLYGKLRLKSRVELALYAARARRLAA